MATLDLERDENQTHSKGIVTRNFKLVYSGKNKPMLTLQVRLRRRPDMPRKLDRNGRDEPDFPVFSVQGAVAEKLQDMPVGTPVVVTGALTTRWVGPRGNQHMVTEVYVLGVSIIKYQFDVTTEPGDTPDLGQPPAPQMIQWVPEATSDADAPIPVGATIGDGGTIVASYKVDGHPVMHHSRKDKHKNNRANRRARALVVRLVQSDVTPSPERNLPESLSVQPSNGNGDGNNGGRHDESESRN